MQTDPHKSMIALCDAFAAHKEVSHWRVSFMVRGDGQFFHKLKTGKSCTLKTAGLVLRWFADHWPEDLAWPDGIERPQPDKTPTRAA
jgi:hypothetical protein